MYSYLGPVERTACPQQREPVTRPLCLNRDLRVCLCRSLKVTETGEQVARLDKGSILPTHRLLLVHRLLLGDPSKLRRKLGIMVGPFRALRCPLFRLNNRLHTILILNYLSLELRLRMQAQPAVKILQEA